MKSIKITGFVLCLILIVVIIFMNSCATQYRCTPSKKSRDYARQWMHQRSDGYWVVTTDSKFKGMKQTVFECRPDSTDMLNLL